MGLYHYGALWRLNIPFRHPEWHSADRRFLQATKGCKTEGKAAKIFRPEGGVFSVFF